MLRLLRFPYRFAEQVLNSKLALKQEIEGILTDPSIDVSTLSRPHFNDVLKKRFVAVILTQSWCPQWTSLDIALTRVAEERDDLEIDIYELEYDLTDFFADFLRFKENTLKNREIPYIRYYIDGRLVAETNYITTNGFLEKFNPNEWNRGT